MQREWLVFRIRKRRGDIVLEREEFGRTLPHCPNHFGRIFRGAIHNLCEFRGKRLMPLPYLLRHLANFFEFLVGRISEKRKRKMQIFFSGPPRRPARRRGKQLRPSFLIRKKFRLRFLRQINCDKNPMRLHRVTSRIFFVTSSGFSSAFIKTAFFFFIWFSHQSFQPNIICRVSSVAPMASVPSRLYSLFANVSGLVVKTITF